jgi:hypothetical protein
MAVIPNEMNFFFQRNPRFVGLKRKRFLILKINSSLKVRNNIMQGNGWYYSKQARRKNGSLFQCVAIK